MELLSSELRFVQSGPRSVSLRSGFRFELSPERLNELGPVDFVLGEEDEASVTLAEHVGDLSWHLLISLPPDAAVIRFEGRVFNRSWTPVPYNASFVCDELGLHLVSGDWVGNSRFADSADLMPHQLDVWGVEVVPGPADAVSVTNLGALRIGETLGFQATRPIQGKMFIQLETGQTLEAPIDVLPEAPFMAPLPGPVSAVAIRDENGETIFSWASGQEAPETDVDVFSGGPSLAFAAHRMVETGLLPSLGKYEFDLRTKSAAKCLRAMSAVRIGDFEEGRRLLDDSLNSNAEDHLVWLLRAIVARKLGEETDDLLNAHYLAPLEPLLRMESFLAQNHQTKEASPLVAPLAESPDALVGGACFLYELGLWDELSRWIDECLRHREIPMLRYFLADALLASSPMSVDAANHIARAAQAPINPPYPWRPVEGFVLRRLHARFPQDTRLSDLVGLVAAAGRG